MSDLLGAAQGKPQCISVVLCNEVLEDKFTNNKTLVGLFNTIATAHLPAIHPRLFVMISMTDGVGKWALAVSFRSPSGKEIARLQGDMEFGNPHVVQDVVLEVLGLPVTEEGQYFIDVLVDGALVNVRKFTVHLLKGEGH